MRQYSSGKYVIVNADDLGLSKYTNLAIRDSFYNGIVTSASLLVTCPGYNHAKKIIKKIPSLGIGIHLSLTIGQSILPKSIIPQLVNDKKFFYPGYLRLILMKNTSVLQQIEQEFSSQIEKAQQDGIKLDHIDSQEHVHMIPHIFPVVIKLAKKYHIPYVRFSKDQVLFTKNMKENIKPFINMNIIKLLLLNYFSSKNNVHRLKVKTPDSFHGVFYSSNISEEVLRNIFSKAQRGITEIITHPGYSHKKQSKFYYDKQKIDKFMLSPLRKREFDALVASKIKKAASPYNISFITFKKAAQL